MAEPFESSEAWKQARILTNEVYALCRREPLSKDFGLRDQPQGPMHSGGEVDQRPHPLARWPNRTPDARRQASSPYMSCYHRDHLQYLETEAIHVMREVAAEFERPALLFSGGK